MGLDHAIALRREGRLTEAAEAFAEIAAGTSDAELQATALTERCRALMRLRTPDALGTARAEMERMAEEAELPRHEGLARLQLGTLDLHGARFSDALLQLSAALELLAGEREWPAALDALGAYWAAVGHCTRARSYYERAIERKEDLGDRDGLALSFGQLGRLFLAMGQWTDARTAFERDLELCEQLGDRRGSAQCLNHLAQAAIQLGDPEGALAFLERAGDMAFESPVALGYLAKDRAHAFRLLGRGPDALSELDKAAELLVNVPYALCLLDHCRGLCLADADLIASAANRLAQMAIGLERIPMLLDLFELGGELRHLEEALRLAEVGRADTWVDRIERRLAVADRQRWLTHSLQRVQGMRPAGTALTADSRFVAVLFSDIAGFTKWSSNIPAQEVVHSLNDYFERMAASVSEHGGYLDKYIGDGLMVLFADGAPHDAIVKRACRCALSMIEALAEVNRDRELTGRDPFGVRLGLSAGQAVVGNMGSYSKVAFTSVGREVNLAARLEGLGTPGRILCSPNVRNLAEGDLVFASAGVVHPKGLDPLEAWWLVDDRRTSQDLGVAILPRT